MCNICCSKSTIKYTFSQINNINKLYTIMWLKIIMILISLFMIYHLFYDVKIWSNGGPLIEGMDGGTED